MIIPLLKELFYNNFKKLHMSQKWMVFAEATQTGQHLKSIVPKKLL